MSLWELLTCAPTVANILNHMQHDMHEFQVIGAWAPTYYNQALGVPISRVGNYIFWPMICAIPAKFLMAAWESALIDHGATTRTIRRRAGLLAATVAIPCSVLFVAAPTPILATVAYCGFVFGQVWDNAADGSNVLEIGGPDIAQIASWSSTAAWGLGLLCASALSALKQLTGSWAVLFLTPAASRCVVAWFWARRCSARSAREYVLATTTMSPEDYLAAQEFVDDSVTVSL